MLLAEIHGKSVPDARDAEDYLTSAAFGHLRYVPPEVFWPHLFVAARSPDGRSLADVLPGGATRLELEFWPSTTHGEPDLILTLHDTHTRPTVVVIEVKLWAGKSGIGEHDQLIRYLRGVPDSRLIYLTPGDPFADIADSLRSPIAVPDDARRLFGLRWQTLQDIARRSAASAPSPFDRILSDVATFLDRLGLSGFDGWKDYPDLTGLAPARAPWATQFRTVPNLSVIPTPARWTHAP